jgi:hypothetical protein
MLSRTTPRMTGNAWQQYLHTESGAVFRGVTIHLLHRSQTTHTNTDATNHISETSTMDGVSGQLSAKCGLRARQVQFSTVLSRPPHELLPALPLLGQGKDTPFAGVSALSSRLNREMPGLCPRLSLGMQPVATILPKGAACTPAAKVPETTRDIRVLLWPDLTTPFTRTCRTTQLSAVLVSAVTHTQAATVHLPSAYRSCSLGVVAGLLQNRSGFNTSETVSRFSE